MTTESAIDLPAGGLNKRARRHGAWLLATSLLLVTTLSLLPAPQAGPGLGHDKLMHALAFAWLGITGLTAWRAWRPHAGAWAPGAWLIAWGAWIELAQSLTATRQAEGLDLLADAVGVAIGVSLVLVWCRFRAALPAARPSRGEPAP